MSRRASENPIHAPDFRALFESAPGLFMVLAPDSPRFTILAATDAYLRAVKKRREDMIGRPVFEVFPDNPEDPSGAEANSRASFERVLARRLPDSQSIQQHDVARPDGQGFETHFWSPLNTPVLDEHGRIRREAEAARAREERLEAFYNSGLVGVIFWDADGVITAANDADGQPQRVFGVNVDITARRQAEEELKASLREKEILLKEIHHRVKNNMQVISSLVALQAERSGDCVLGSILADVSHRLRSMALVHEQLHQSPDVAEVDFAEYARSLLNYLWRAHGEAASRVDLVLDLQPLRLPVNTAVPCGLILNELVTNALKHAFKGAKEGPGGPGRAVTERGAEAQIEVALGTLPDGRVRLEVRDNGPGFPAGLDWRQAGSLGLHLVQTLARQLHATVEVKGGPGTEFILHFPGAGP